MAKITFPDTAMGTTLNVGVSFRNKRVPKKGIEFSTVGYEADRFTTVPLGQAAVDPLSGQEYFEMQTEVVSEAACPVTATCHVTVGKSEYRVSADRTASRHFIPCDSRWIAEDASTATGDLVWPAAQGRTPFDIVAPAGAAPLVLDDASYSFYDTTSNSWAASSAVSFSGAEYAVSEDGVWTTNPLRDGGFGVLGVWVLNDAAGEMPIMEFAYSGPAFGVYLDRNNNIILKYGATYREALQMHPSWFSVPIRIGLFFIPQWNVVAISVKAGGRDTVEKSATLPVKDLASVVTTKIGLMWGPSEDSCELLDLCAWRSKLSGEELDYAKGEYTKLYGV